MKRAKEEHIISEIDDSIESDLWYRAWNKIKAAKQSSKRVIT